MRTTQFNNNTNYQKYTQGTLTETQEKEIPNPTQTQPQNQIANSQPQPTEEEFQVMGRSLWALTRGQQ